MSDDLPSVVNSVVASAPAAAAAVALGYAAKKVFGPTLDLAGERVREMVETRHRNINQIAEKAERLAPSTADLFPHPRVTKQVLNDASFYDDDVMQTYVAGLLSASRNIDGSDDRPVYFLTVIDGLSAIQLRLFHVLYSALLAAGPLVPDKRDPGLNFVTVKVQEIEDAVESFGPSPDYSVIAFVALEHAGLISTLSIDTSSGVAYLRFQGTRIGAALFDWAHGIEDERFTLFYDRERPDLGLPKLTFVDIHNRF